MTSSTPHPAADRHLVSPVDRQLADALRDAGRSWGAVPEDVATRHLAAITVLAAEHVHGAARPPASTWRSRMRRVAGLTIVKVAVGAGVAAATTGGLAAGGNLPDPIQGAVADGAGWVGIDLPRPAPTATADPADDASGSPEPVVDPEDLPEEGPVDAPAHEDVPGSAPADAAEVDDVPAPGPVDPAEPPNELPPSADDHAGPPAEAPARRDDPEVGGRDERPARPDASSAPGDDDAGGAEERTGPVRGGRTPTGGSGGR